jgi:formate dehydrogenase subunit gamma
MRPVDGDGTQRVPVDPDEYVRSVITAHRGEPGPLLVILRSIQDGLGHVPPSCLPTVAKALNLSRADVYGVMTFYRDFRDAPGGRVMIQICRAEACQAVGAEELATHARQRLGIEFGATTPDGAASLDQTFCFGNCALGPAVRVNDRLCGRVDASGFDRLIAEAVR